MKFTLPRKEALEAVKTCLSVVGGTTLPILSCLKLEARDGKVILTSSNLDRWMECKVAAEITKPGSIAISGKLLAGILAGGSDPTIEVDEKNKVKVTAGGSTFRFPGLDASEFPDLPKMRDEPSVIEISTEDWLASSRAVAWSASTDGTRPTLNGTLIAGGEDFHLVSTDGRCLSQTIISDSEGFDWDLIVPTATMAAIDLLASQDGNLFLKTNGTLLFASCGDRMMASKVIEGHFPNYRQVIPEIPATATRLTVATDAMVDTLKRMQVIMSDTPCVTVTIGEGTIQLSSSGKDDSEATATVEATVSGPDQKIRINPTYLLSALQRWALESVELTVIDEMSPMLMTADRLLFVLMPMRLS